MFYVRPAQPEDVGALVDHARQGVHSLPHDAAAMAQVVCHSMASFDAAVKFPGEEAYLFVLASSGDDAVHGAAMLSARAGASGTFFAFRNEVIHQVSRDLDISHSVHVLELSSDLTAHAQLSGFWVRTPGRTDAAPDLLSRARLLFAAAEPHRIGESVFASPPGFTHADGTSPFWEALGRKFFDMDFLAAERAVQGTRNRSLIVELMPHYPIYVPLLPGSAQAAMGQVHPQGELSYRILADEGFGTDQFIDIFDGGLILQASRQALRSFSQSTLRRARHAATVPDAGAVRYLVTNRKTVGFRAILAECLPVDHTENVHLTDAMLRVLDVVPGDYVLCTRL